MSQPEGLPNFENLTEPQTEPTRVCRLNKSLYGLKQSPRQWYKKFNAFMVSVNFSRSNYDSCVYLKELDDESFVYLLLYVDDILIASSNLGEIKRLKADLNSVFEMKDLGPAKKILGMEISRNRPERKLTLSQAGFAEKVLRRFDMHKSKVVSNPLTAHFKLSGIYLRKSI
jgi:ATP-binding cassette subfamily B (MDR/TAP) protein 1